MLIISLTSALLLISTSFLVIEGKYTQSQTTPQQAKKKTTTSEEGLTTPQDEPGTSTDKPIPEHKEPSTPTDKPHQTEPDMSKDETDGQGTSETAPTYDESFNRWFGGMEWSSQECKDAVLARYAEPDLADLNCGSVDMFLEISDAYRCNRNEKCQMLSHFCKNSADGEKEFIIAKIYALCH